MVKTPGKKASSAPPVIITSPQIFILQYVGYKMIPRTASLLRVFVGGRGFPKFCEARQVISGKVGEVFQLVDQARGKFLVRVIRER